MRSSERSEPVVGVGWACVLGRAKRGPGTRAIAVALLAAFALSSCGGAQVIDTGQEKRTQIAILWAQIRDWRREGHMPLDPPRAFEIQLERLPVQEAKHVCPDNHEVPKTCDDVCNLGDAICDNAEQICKLADELGKDDTFAQVKCTSAKASCREARQRCCDCSGVPK